MTDLHPATDTEANAIGNLNEYLTAFAMDEDERLVLAYHSPDGIADVISMGQLRAIAGVCNRYIAATGGAIDPDEPNDCNIAEYATKKSTGINYEDRYFKAELVKNLGLSKAKEAYAWVTGSTSDS